MACVILILDHNWRILQHTHHLLLDLQDVGVYLDNSSPATLSPVYIHYKAPSAVICNNKKQSSAFLLGHIQGNTIKRWS